MIPIIGTSLLRFGDLWEKSLRDLIRDIGSNVMADAGLNNKDVDIVYISNVFAAEACGISSLSSVVFKELGISNSVCINNGDNSGAIAIQEAAKSIESGKSKIALVLGVEKLSDLKSSAILELTSRLLDEEESIYGATVYSQFALMTSKYLAEHNLHEKDFAFIPSKNHKNAVNNEFAQFKSEIGEEKILQSSFVSEPLRVLEIAPFSDGAAAMILCSKEAAKKYKIKGHFISGSTESDFASLSKRESITAFESSSKAMKNCLSSAKIDKSKIEILELHDIAPISEVIAVESLGFAEKGKGIGFIKNNSGKINLSGGLKACGHAIGATGIRQAIGVLKQLESHKAKYGLAHTLTGDGSSSGINIFGGPNV